MIIDSHCHAGKGDGLTGPWDTDAVGITDYVDDAGPIAGPDNEPQRWHMMRTRHVWGPVRHLQNGWRMLRRR